MSPKGRKNKLAVSPHQFKVLISQCRSTSWPCWLTQHASSPIKLRLNGHDIPVDLEPISNYSNKSCTCTLTSLDFDQIEEAKKTCLWSFMSPSLPYYLFLFQIANGPILKVTDGLADESSSSVLCHNQKGCNNLCSQLNLLWFTIDKMMISQSISSLFATFKWNIYNDCVLNFRIV